MLYTGSSYLIPTTALSGRRFMEVCSSDRNASTAVITCRLDSDGGIPIAIVNSPGPTFVTGKCKGYAVDALTQLRCVTDTSDAGMTVTECK